VKFLKLLSIAALCSLLLACGHGFEGEYQAETGSSNEFLSAFAGMQPTRTVVIGSDYMEAEGERTEFEDIFVREKGETRYLVFKDKDTEKAWKIIDDDTLLLGNGFVNITLKRVK
jgi:hypothetical protein